MSIDEAESLARRLECGVYHAHLDPRQRQLTIDALHISSAAVLVGTSALGSGVDFHNVTMTIHWRGAHRGVE